MGREKKENAPPGGGVGRRGTWGSCGARRAGKKVFCWGLGRSSGREKTSRRWRRPRFSVEWSILDAFERRDAAGASGDSCSWRENPPFGSSVLLLAFLSRSSFGYGSGENFTSYACTLRAHRLSTVTSRVFPSPAGSHGVQGCRLEAKVSSGRRRFRCTGTARFTAPTDASTHPAYRPLRARKGISVFRGGGGQLLVDSSDDEERPGAPVHGV